MCPSTDTLKGSVLANASFDFVFYVREHEKEEVGKKFVKEAAMEERKKLLREVMINACRAACLGEEFPRVSCDWFEIESASEEKLLEIAERMGIEYPNQKH